MIQHLHRRRNLKRAFVYVVIAVSVVTFCYSCENRQEDIDALNTKLSAVDQATKVEAYLSQDGKTKARLTAPLMLRINADTNYTEFPKTLHVDFYSGLNIIETRLDAGYGKYFETLNKVYLHDSVRVISANGDTLYCQDLWWDQAKDFFYTDKPAQQRSPGRVINGRNGLEATSPTKNFNIKFKTVTGIVPTKEGDIPR